MSCLLLIMTIKIFESFILRYCTLLYLGGHTWNRYVPLIHNVTHSSCCPFSCCSMSYVSESLDDPKFLSPMVETILILIYFLLQPKSHCHVNPISFEEGCQAWVTNLSSYLFISLNLCLIKKKGKYFLNIKFLNILYLWCSYSFFILSCIISFKWFYFFFFVFNFSKNYFYFLKKIL